MRDDTIVHCFSVQWDYCDLSKRQDRSVLLNYKERSYCSYLLRYWVPPSSVLWVVQEFFEIKTLDFGAKDLGKHTTKHRISVLKIYRRQNGFTMCQCAQIYGAFASRSQSVWAVLLIREWCKPKAMCDGKGFFSP